MREIAFDAQGSIATLGASLQDMARRHAALLILAADGNDWHQQPIAEVVAQCTKPIFGGVFPRIIHQGHSYEQGTLVLGLPVVPEVVRIDGLSQPQTDFDEQLGELAERWIIESAPEETLMVFVDGLASGIAALVEGLFVNFGLERNFIGGGCGSLSFEQRPCLITHEGLCADAALLVRLPLASAVGVAHGWLPISAPLEVTSAERNVIHTLDWRPAFDVYRELVESHSGRRFDEHSFFDLAKSYPFGISRLEGELIVRDPLQVSADGQGLICVGEVPERCHVRLLNGTVESLVAAAGEARQLALHAAADRTLPHALFIDCISRVLFLETHFERELATAAAGHPLVGALTLGEIANNGRDYLEFYNKTAVLGLFADA